MGILERFLKYVSFDTESDENSTSFPSTSKQLILLKHLAEEMKELGLDDVEMDKYGYVMGTIPATPSYENCPVIGFIAHVDTSPDMSGADIKPKIVKDYAACDIRLNDDLLMKLSDFPELAFYKGHTLIVTDGTTLLGADDKAGVAEIMSAAEYLIQHREIVHGKIRIAFTPDEEIGRGVDFFDVKRFGADFAYTMDGGFEGELEYENFNAAAATLIVKGRNIHPGSAKNKMINSLQVITEFNSLLPANERPEHTENYEGFYHLVGISGSVESARIDYIVRDHDRQKFEARKIFLEDAAGFLSKKYGEGVINLELRDQYYNMKEMVEPYPEIINKAKEAMLMVGVQPIVKPIRGGTDGARLSYMGLPCPNLFTGGGNFHGKYEYCSLDTMRKARSVIINLCKLWSDSIKK